MTRLELDYLRWRVEVMTLAQSARKERRWQDLEMLYHNYWQTIDAMRPCTLRRARTDIPGLDHRTDGFDQLFMWYVQHGRAGRIDNLTWRDAWALAVHQLKALAHRPIEQLIMWGIVWQRP